MRSSFGSWHISLIRIDGRREEELTVNIHVSRRPDWGQPVKTIPYVEKTHDGSLATIPSISFVSNT
jgi:hypothetical protein